MAVIQQIRSRYGKVAGAVIGVALVSFIISDARNGSFGSVFGGKGTHVVTVDGTDVEAREYEMRVKEYETLTNIYSNRGPITDEARAQIREQVLQSVAYEAVVNKMCDKLGITTSEQEKKDLIYGQNAHPLVKQFSYEGRQVFNNENNQFDPARVKGIEDDLMKNGAKNDPYGKFMEQWTAVKNYVIRNSRIDKFNAMVSGSVYSPVYEAKRNASLQGNMASIRFVKVPFTSIPDNDIKVTDDDLKAYMQKHKGLFENEQASRTIDYVSFDIIPASADSSRASEALQEMMTEFRDTKDNKVFVGNKTDDVNAYSEAYVNKKTFATRFADTIMAQPAGSLFGPYFENGSYRITKVIDKKVQPDSTKCRHILVKVSEGGKEILNDSAAKSKIDSIAAAISGGAKFDSMVAKFSDDEGSKPTNGEYWFNLQQRVSISKEFGDFIFEGKVGERKVVKADNSKTNGYVGYHYIEILEQKGEAPTVQVATITRSLAPTDSTVNAIYGRANDFTSKSTSAAEFDASAKKMGYDKRVGENIKENSFTIQGLGNAREIVKWAYEHKVGDVSANPFHLGDLRYVVAKLVAIDDKGLMGINSSNRPQLEQRVREEKKAEAIKNKYKGAALESIGQTTSQPVQQSDSVTLGAPYIPNLGFEPKVVGYTFNAGFQPNTVSPGIIGQGGVYFISVLSRNTIPMNPMNEQNDIMAQRRQQDGQLRQYIGQMLQPSVTRNAEIKYNMANF